MYRPQVGLPGRLPKTGTVPSHRHELQERTHASRDVWELHPPCTCNGGRGKGKFPSRMPGTGGTRPTGFGCGQREHPPGTMAVLQRWLTPAWSWTPWAPLRCYRKLLPQITPQTQKWERASQASVWACSVLRENCHQEPCCNRILIQMHFCNMNVLLSEIKTIDNRNLPWFNNQVESNENAVTQPFLIYILLKKKKAHFIFYYEFPHSYF